MIRLYAGILIGVIFCGVQNSYAVPFAVDVSSIYESGGLVGIGTTNPATKLHMSSGTLTVDGTGGAINVAVGSVTASAFFGDGSHLSGIAGVPTYEKQSPPVRRPTGLEPCRDAPGMRARNEALGVNGSER